MPGPGFVETSLIIVEAVASATLVLRFLLTGLHRVYRFFFLYLVLSCIQLGGQFFFQRKTTAYGAFYFLTEALIVFLYVLVTLELYSLILRDWKGIATVARRFIHVAIAISILVSLLLLGIEQTPKTFTAVFFSLERPIVSSLIIFVIFITGFLSYYPIPLNRNVISYTIGYAFYFLSKATVLLFINRGQYWIEILSTALLAICAACLVFWVFALTREGESKPTISGPNWNKAAEHRVVGKLTELNESLLRSRKRLP